MNKLYMIGNTHFDPVWLWEYDEALASIRATFKSALDRMDEDENFIYSFATPPVFEWIKEVDPELFKRIKKRVKEGRWEISEGWYLQPDCFVGGESFVRQGVYGQKYLKENFKKTADTVMNVDSFGHPAMLPQILKKCGVKNYCFVRPENHHYPLQEPLFMWRSADGSTVNCYRAENGWHADTEMIMNMYTADSGTDRMIYYGVTDHGGAPTKKAIQAINKKENAYFSTVSDFFKGHIPKEERFGEFLTGDFGTYVNHPEIKRLLRSTEREVIKCEKAAAISDRKIKKYLDECWKDILFCQFHDIIGGTCIKDAYVYCKSRLDRAFAHASEQLNFSIQSITKDIKTVGKNPDDIWNIVAWNLNGKNYNGYMEAEVQWAHEFPWYDKSISLADENGNVFPAQIIAEKSVIPAFRSRFIFKAEIPSMGYKTFKVVKTEKEVKKDLRTFNSVKIKDYTVLFGKDGLIEKILIGDKDVKCGKILHPKILNDDGDTWCFNVKGFGAEKDKFTLVSEKTTENGELILRTVKVYKAADIKLTLEFTFYKQENYFDLKYIVNNESTHSVIKLVSEVKTENTKAVTPFYSAERGGNAMDMPVGEWLTADGITYILDGVPSYNAAENKLGLSLLRSPIYGDLRISELDTDKNYDYISMGITEGKIRVDLSAGEWDAADEFLNAPVIIAESNHDGRLAPCDSYLKVDGKVTLSAFKPCEKGKGVAVRLFETDGLNKNVTISCFGKKFNVCFKPYEIKTLKICKDKITETDFLEERVKDK